MIVSTDRIFKKAYFIKQKEKEAKKERYPKELKRALAKSIQRTELQKKK